MGPYVSHLRQAGNKRDYATYRGNARDLASDQSSVNGR